MTDPKFNVKVRSGGQSSEGEVVVKGGTEIEITYDPLSFGMGLDYTSPDQLKLVLDGEMTVKKKGDESLVVGAGLTHDFLREQTQISGRLEWTFDKNVALAVTGFGNQSQDGTSGGGTATLTLRF